MSSKTAREQRAPVAQEAHVEARLPQVGQASVVGAEASADRVPPLASVAPVLALEEAASRIVGRLDDERAAAVADRRSPATERQELVRACAACQLMRDGARARRW